MFSFQKSRSHFESLEPSNIQRTFEESLFYMSSKLLPLEKGFPPSFFFFLWLFLFTSLQKHLMMYVVPNTIGFLLKDEWYVFRNVIIQSSMHRKNPTVMLSYTPFKIFEPSKGFFSCPCVEPYHTVFYYQKGFQVEHFCKLKTSKDSWRTISF